MRRRISFIMPLMTMGFLGHQSHVCVVVKALPPRNRENAERTDRVFISGKSFSISGIRPIRVIMLFQEEYG